MKKYRVQNTLKSHSAEKLLPQLLAESKVETNLDPAADFKRVIEDDCYLLCKKESRESLFRVAGAGACKIVNGLKCSRCYDLLVKGKVNESSNYLFNLSRGGLLEPSSVSIEVVFHLTSILHRIQDDPELERRFWRSQSKLVLIGLTLNSIKRYSKIVNLKAVCDLCQSENIHLIERLCGFYANTTLNHYVDQRTETEISYMKKPQSKKTAEEPLYNDKKTMKKAKFS